MTTPTQLAANAANAQLSTGPRTPEGKQRSARNALTHGLTAREVVILPGERPAFDEMRADLEDDLRPQGALEHTLFAQLVHAAWNLRRLRLLEAGLVTDAPDPLLDRSLERDLDRLARYHARAERSFYRALRELRALQAGRAKAEMTKRTQPLASSPPLEHLDAPVGQHVREYLARPVQPADLNALDFPDAPQPEGRPGLHEA